MAVEVYLGNPPEHIIQWIKDHSGPAPRAVTRIWWSNDESDYSDCPSNKGTFDDTCFPEGKYYLDTVKVEFGSDVTSIGLTTFSNCGGLTSVTIPNSVTSIGGYAFSLCSNLTSVTISDSVTNIGEWAFSACDGLTSMTIPYSVTNIGENTFEYCSGLTNMTFLGKTLEQVLNIEDGNGKKYYPWGISDPSIINVA